MREESDRHDLLIVDRRKKQSDRSGDQLSEADQSD